MSGRHDRPAGSRVSGVLGRLLRLDVPSTCLVRVHGQIILVPLSSISLGQVTSHSFAEARSKVGNAPVEDSTDADLPGTIASRNSSIRGSRLIMADDRGP